MLGKSFLHTAKLADTCASDAEPSALWRPYTGGPESKDEDLATGVGAARLADWLRRVSTVPLGFQVHPKLQRLLATRLEMADRKKPLDWGAGETLALPSLGAGGVRIRLTGQDAARGRFSPRHAVLHNHADGYM